MPSPWQLFSSRRAAIAASLVSIPLAVALIAFGVVARIRPLALCSLWGLLLLGAFIGWGALFYRLAYGKQRGGWSMEATFGMAIAIAYGGLVCSLSIASRGMLFGFVAIGLLLYAWSVSDAVAGAYEQRLWARWRSIPVAYALGVLALMTVLGFQYVGAIAEYRLNVGDDLLAYASYPRRILETGTLIDPFSARRMSAYGGQSFLQTFTMLAGAERNLNQLDGGLCVIVICGLFFQEARRVRQRLGWLVLLVLLFVLMLPGRRFNLGGWMSGAVFLFAAYRLLRWQPFASSRGTANAVALALLMSALCTLRHSYMTMGALLVLLTYGWSALTVDRAPGRLRPLLRELVLCGVTTVVLLLPWMVLAYRSNRSFLFPIMKGYYNPEYLLFAGSFRELTGLMRVKAIWGNVMHDDPIKTLPFFLVPALFLADSSERKALRVVVVMALISFFTVVWKFPGSDPFSNERYTFAALLPAVLATLIASLELLNAEPSQRTTSQLAAAAIAFVAVALQIHETRASMFKTFETHLDRIWEASKDKRQPWREYAYQELQNRVPAGAPIAAMVDEPHNFDFRRNRILLLDLPGAASPPPGWPLLGARKESTDYFLGQGLRYLALVKPTASKESYRRSHWERQSRGWPWKLIIQYYRAMFGYVDDISREKKLLYDDGQMVLVDLAQDAEPDNDDELRGTSGRTLGPGLIGPRRGDTEDDSSDDGDETPQPRAKSPRHANDSSSRSGGVKGQIIDPKQRDRRVPAVDPASR